MVVIASIFTALVATVHAWTRSGIAANRRQREVRGVFGALGVTPDRDTAPRQLSAMAEMRLEPLQRDGLTFYRGYDADRKLMGYVFPIGGPGFWGPIRGYVAIDSEGERIIGITFVDHVETPGLGARIEEDWFRQQFVGKSIAVPDGQELGIRLVPAGKPKREQDVDAITGATGTSTAVEKFLDQNLAAIRKAMERRKDG